MDRYGEANTSTINLRLSQSLLLVCSTSHSLIRQWCPTNGCVSVKHVLLLLLLLIKHDGIGGDGFTSINEITMKQLTYYQLD